MLRLREVLPVEARNKVARVREVRLGRGAAVVYVPANMVAVQVGVRHDVDVLGACALRADGVQEVAPDVATVGMGTGAHAGVHHHSLAHRAHKEVAVVELYLPFFEDVFVRLPVCCGYALEEGVGWACRRDHVQREYYLGVAHSDTVSHEITP